MNFSFLPLRAFFAGFLSFRMLGAAADHGVTPARAETGRDADGGIGKGDLGAGADQAQAWAFDDLCFHRKKISSQSPVIT